MSADYFVKEDSIVRRIWGKSDTILFIFAGAAAEFALNKAVDWLYFTGRLPVDPLGRLFSTVGYARAIVFSDTPTALRAIESMRAIHAGVESKRGQHIPDWAYRDVLFMLIDYSIRAYEVLERPLSYAEKADVFEAFNRLGNLMGVQGLPKTFDEWTAMRHAHLVRNLKLSDYTRDLFQQYRKHLGPLRFRIVLEAQTLVVPDVVRQLLGFRKLSLLHPLLLLYKLTRSLKVEWVLKEMILPAKHKEQIRQLDNRMAK